MVAVLGSLLLFLGLLIGTVGLYGILRRPEIFEQLHAAGLITGPGVVLVLMASIATERGDIITSAGLVVAFVLVTSSLSTHAIANAAWRRARTANLAGGVASETSATPLERAATDSSDGPMRVLLAHDATPAADIATRLVASLALPDGSAIRLVGVTEGDLPTVADLGGRELPPRRGSLSSGLDEALRQLGRPGVIADRVARTGRPAEAIADEASTFAAQIVVVGSRSLGPLRSLLMGSVARELVGRAPCPVLVARSHSLRTVLLATDGSPASASAIAAVAYWPIFDGARVHVLTAALDGREAIAEQVASRLSALGRDASAHAAGGRAAHAILAFAREASVDVIVLGSRGHPRVRRVLFGSVGAEVLASARSSVLIVGSKDEGRSR